MTPDQFETLLAYGALAGILMFFVVIVFKLFSYRGQLQKAYLQLDMTWPFPSQSELLRKLQTDFISGLYATYMIPISAVRIIFFMRTDNSILLGPIRGIRRCFAAFFIFPIVLFFVMVILSLIFFPPTA